MKYYISLLILTTSLFLSCNSKEDSHKKNTETYENRFEGSRYNIQEHDTLLLEEMKSKERLKDSVSNNLDKNY